MKFDKVQFVYIDTKYLEALHKADSEIFLDKEDSNYAYKPHLGVLLNGENRKYVIPLTSAKEKHKAWADTSAGWYRIYEIIDITKTVVKEKDVIVDIKNQNILKKIENKERNNYRQRILSILDIRKMIPVKEGVYQEIKFEIKSGVPKAENQRMALMMKEYMFLLGIADKIEVKAKKIYEKQMKTGKVLKYHCNFKKLEEVADKWE